jgi:peptidoglycan/LPS O-acetylase OafA/YrhL
MATMVITERQRVDGQVRANSAHPRTQSARLEWIDAVRAFLAILVVVHHAGQPYGGDGVWPVQEATRSNVLGVFFPVNAAFFMGLFFLIAAYFIPASCDRKGAGAFVRDRAVRLGGPLLIVGLGIFGLTGFFEYRGDGGTGSFWSFYVRDYVGSLQVELGHLWFVAHLLVYAGAYALWRQFSGRRLPVATSGDWVPGHRAILTYALALAVVTCVVRIWYPIDRWERLLGIIPTEVAHLPQYLSLFVIGLVAAQHDWLRRIPTATGMTWLGIGLGAAALRYAYSLWPAARLPGIINQGGADWRSLVWSTWEALICAGLCVGLLVLARERFGQPGRVVRMVAARSYAIYILHVFVLVAVQAPLVDVALPPLAKFAIVALVGVPLSVAFAAVFRWPRSVRRASSRRKATDRAPATS